MEALTSGSNPEGETPLESDSQRRALTNEYILAEVLSYLSVKDLKECRFVNRVWNQEATRMIASDGEILHFGPEARRYYICIFIFSKYTRMKHVAQFLDTMSNSWNFPFRKFRVDSNIMRDATSEEKLILLRFMEYVAPIATHLEISSMSCKLFSEGPPEKVLQYPKLTSLKLYIRSWLLSMESNLDFMISVLEHAPKLEKLSLVYDEFGDGAADLAFRGVMERVPWNNIRHLKLDGILRDADAFFQRIMELGPEMKLDSFKYYNGDLVHFAPQMLLVFLENQRENLKDLSLYMLQYTWITVPLTLPQFPVLKSLDVDLGADNPLRSFSQRFPILNSLTILHRWAKLENFVRSEDPLETLQELSLNQEWAGGWNTKIDESRRIIRHFSQLFPRVRKLSVPAHRVIMEAIEKEGAWKDLTELTLLCTSGNSGHVDHALTGYSSGESDQIRKMLPGSPEFQQAEVKAERKIYKFFHELRTLNLKGTVGTFSDTSCRLVLLKLRNLKCLNLFNLRGYYKEDQVSEEMLREMSAKLEVLYKKKKTGSQVVEK